MLTVFCRKAGLLHVPRHTTQLVALLLIHALLFQDLHCALLDAVLGGTWPRRFDLILVINQLLVERLDLVIERPHSLVYRVCRVGEGRQRRWRFLLAPEKTLHCAGLETCCWRAVLLEISLALALALTSQGDL